MRNFFVKFYCWCPITSHCIYVIALYCM